MTTEVWPAAETATFFAAMKPFAVSTPVTRPSGAAADRGDRAVLDDVDAAGGGGAGVAPGDGVVAGGAGAALEGGAEDGVAGAGIDVERRAEGLGLGGGQPGVVDAVQAVRVDVALGGLHVVDVVGEHHHAALGVHDVVVQVLGEGVPEVEGVVVEPRALVVEVVRADDGGVAPGVAAAEPALVDHRDVGDAVFLRQVVGGAEAVAAGADDDHVVGRLRGAVGPLGGPVLLAGQRALDHLGEGEVRHCRDSWSARAHP